jgi:hypothetical protein
MRWAGCGTFPSAASPYARDKLVEEAEMGFGRGALLWLLGIPLPIIIIIALLWH